MNSINKTARIAGMLYLLTIVFGVFAQYVRSTFIVPGDAAATVGNIMASESLFRFGFMSDLIMTTCYLLLALVLYVLLKPVDKNLSLSFVLFTSLSVAIMCLNMLNQFAPLVLLSGESYLTVFNADQLNALALVFLNLQRYGYLIAQLFFGIWLLPLGYVVSKSRYFPRVLGVLLMIACFGHLTEFFQVFLFPNQAAITTPALIAATLGEFSFCFWLLFKGANIQEMDIHAIAST